MLVKKTVTSTILSQLLPLASSTAFTFAKTCRHSASISYLIIFPSASSSSPGIELSFALLLPMPERNNKFPIRLACGYAPKGCAADSVLVILSSIICVNYNHQKNLRSALKLNTNIFCLCKKT